VDRIETEPPRCCCAGADIDLSIVNAKSVQPSSRRAANSIPRSTASEYHLGIGTTSAAIFLRPRTLALRKRKPIVRISGDSPDPPTGCGCRSAVPASVPEAKDMLDRKHCVPITAIDKRIYASAEALSRREKTDAVVTAADHGQDVQIATLATASGDWYTKLAAKRQRRSSGSNSSIIRPDGPGSGLSCGRELKRLSGRQ